MEKPLWQPSEADKQQSQMAKFMRFVNDRWQRSLRDYAQLHRWSVAEYATFWPAVWEFCELKGEIAQATPVQMRDQNSVWFEQGQLNFAENCLQRRDAHPALLYANEHGERQEISYAELYQRVRELAGYLLSLDIAPGDRVAAMMPNCPETVIAMLASTAIGAVWTSCSPDFGLPGLIDRFGQVAPKVLFAVDGHTYQGKVFSHVEKIRQLQQQLPSLVQTIVLPHSKQHDSTTTLPCILFNDAHIKKADFNFNRLPFNHPLYILYSSGTTGKPKCMVHGAGGTLLQHAKELRLHCDVTPNERIFFFTTCGWMMWNWLISSLSVGATVVLYDGSPAYPTPDALIQLIDELNITVFGCGAKYIESLEKRRCRPCDTHKLNSLRSILTTGSPLLSTSFDYIYRDIKSNVQVSSISGGSDIISCFALGNPLLPVYRGELQCIGLGMDVKIFNAAGKPVIAEKGELVCTSPFPSMPIYFWDDPNGEKYHNAYFNQFPQVWTHGDFAEITPHNGLIIYGRSDATLNPSGVRVGTAEIYNQIEKIPDIIDSLAVGHIIDNTEHIILFVVLAKNVTLDDTLITKIKITIRDNTSPMHVPHIIHAVSDLPRTLNGKVCEIAVKKTLAGHPIDNHTSLLNPQILQEFIRCLH